MTTQNIIVADRDNPVVINISGITDEDGNAVLLTDFDQITVSFKDDERNSVDNPDDVIVEDSKLTLYFNDTTETGVAYFTITGTNDLYPNGLEISSSCFNNLDAARVC